MVFGVMATLAMPLFAASGEAFYESVYRRGLAHFQEGNYAVAAGELRLAAFGFVDSIERFETAEAWAAVAAMRAHRDDDARAALKRIVAGEKIESHFASIAIPAEIRRDVETAAKALLNPAELARLNAGAAVPVTAVRTITITNPVATPEPQPPQPQPPQPQPTPAQPPTAQPPQPQPAPQPAAPAANDPAALIAEGDRAIGAGDLAQARQAYSAALDTPSLAHALLLKIGEGLYRARDFRDAASAFGRAGAFAKDEEPYHYYYAVALYESGQYAEAKRELAAALPYIEITRDVEDYRAKIEGAIAR